MAQSTLPPTSSPLRGIDWGTFIPGSTLSYNFVDGGASHTIDGETFLSEDALDYEIAAFKRAFALFEEILDVEFVETSNEAAADLNLIIAEMNSSDLGLFIPPDDGPKEGYGVFNYQGQGWSEAGLKQGGYGFITIIHEIGHGLGLAHPHDDGGRSNLFNGGKRALDEGVYTMMSYEDGWKSAPHGASQNPNYGYQGAPMALDVTLLQDKYGANMDTRSGDDVYTLKAYNGGGAFYSTIWDAGGTDEIRHNGGRNADISLESASDANQYSPGYGGEISYVAGVHGGFTIAAGVVIENATGGGGDDKISGNDADNALRGRGGNDTMRGDAGDDHLAGNGGNDQLFGDAGADRMFGGAGGDTLNGGGGADFMHGGGGYDALNGGGGDDRLIGGGGNDSIAGGGGRDLMTGGAGRDTFIFNAAQGADAITDFQNNIDVIDLSGNSAYNSFADVQAAAFQQGADLVISDLGRDNSGNALTLRNTDIGVLDNSDFIF